MTILNRIAAFTHCGECGKMLTLGSFVRLNPQPRMSICSTCAHNRCPIHGSKLIDGYCPTAFCTKPERRSNYV